MKKRLVSMMLVLCCLFSLVGCGGEASAPSVSDAPPVSSSVEADSPEVVYSGDLAFYASLPDKSICKDKIVEVTGEFTEKSLMNYYIGSTDEDFYVFFYFDKKTDAVKQLKEGDIITVRGECADAEDGKLQLSACELVSVGQLGASSNPVTGPTETSAPSTSTEPTDTPTPSTDPQPTDIPTPPENSTFSIHFIDVGQADAALVECDGHYMLIDGGNKSDSNTIYSVLKKASASHLDIVVGTHAHEDHIGGLPGALNYADADLTLCATKSYDSAAFDDFKKYASQKGGGIVIPSVGDTYSLGSASVKVLGVNGGSDANDTSIVLMITYGETKFLFTGDAEREAEQAILNSGADLSATVLKVGHHGSDTSTTYPFLREIMPTYAVISVGTGNSYGHPTEDTLSRLRDADVKVYRTDLQGDIKCVSDGKTVSFSVAKNANTDTLESVNKTNSTPTPVPTPTPAPTPTPTPEPVPDGAYYVLNTNSRKFHDPDCGSAGKISASNKDYYTGTAEELVAKGYEPCGNCKPYVISPQNSEPAPPASSSTKNDDSEAKTSGTEYIINVNSGKFHYPSCSSAKKMKESNKQYYTGTRTELVNKGYSPCGNCNP